MGKNLVQEKSYAFAVRMVRLYRHLSAKHRELFLSRQLLRCGTSIGANVEEAIGAQSKRDFFAKMTIAYKESRETIYWLRLFKDTGYLSRPEFASLQADVDDIAHLIARIQLTTKKNLAGTGKSVGTSQS